MEDRSAALSPFGVRTVGPTVHDLPAEARQWLQQRGTVRRFRRGETVQHYREPVTYASWLQAGRLRSVIFQSDGSEALGGWIMPDELYSVANLLVQTPSRLNLVVDTDSAQVLTFSLEVLQDLMLRDSDFGLGINVGLVRRMQQMFDIVDVAGPRTLADKLRAVLLWWAKNYGVLARDGSMELWVAQNELATAVGASRQRVHAELQQLRDEGDIALGYRKIVIQPAFFKRAADSPLAHITPSPWQAPPSADNSAP